MAGFCNILPLDMKKPRSLAAAICLSLLALASAGLGQSEKKISPIPTGKSPDRSIPIPKVVPIAAPTTNTPAAPQGVGATTYIVQSGDNPWLIAKKHGVSLEDLLKANTIKDAKNLKIGDEIVIPAGGSSGKSARATVTPVTAAQPVRAEVVTAPTTADNWELYTIKSGDNPWKIAKSLKVDHQKILSLNEGVNFQKLQIGQQIKVPKKS